MRALSGFYYVETEGCEYVCKARGSFRNQRLTPLVGDLVGFETTEPGCGYLSEILPRKNALVRPPLANVDRMFIVSSLSVPAPNTLLIDRQIAACEHKGIEPVVVFNKQDEGELGDLADLYRKAGFTVVVGSAVTGEGVDAIRSLLVEGVNAFSGNSGVGKSSILNALLPGLDLQTGEVSEKLGRGKHTTRVTSLVKMGKALVADTAGFSAFDNDRCEAVGKEDLPDTFREFRPFFGQCRFTGCSHTCEAGCAILAAVKEGKIASSRHADYCTMYQEVKDKKEWNTKK